MSTIHNLVVYRQGGGDMLPGVVGGNAHTQQVDDFKQGDIILVLKFIFFRNTVSIVI